MKRKAFPLVEILIVVILLGILATIAISSFGTSADDTRAAALANVQQQANRLLEVYTQENGALPADAAALGLKNAAAWTLTFSGTSSADWAVSVAAAE